MVTIRADEGLSDLVTRDAGALECSGPEEAVETSIFARAANFFGPRPRPIPPLLTSAEEVAEGMLRCARDPKREVTYRYLSRGVELPYSF